MGWCGVVWCGVVWCVHGAHAHAVCVTAPHTHPAIPQGFHKRVRAVRRRPLPFVEEAEDLLYGVWVWQAAEEKSER